MGSISEYSIFQFGKKCLKENLLSLGHDQRGKIGLHWSARKMEFRCQGGGNRALRGATHPENFFFISSKDEFRT